MNKNERFKIIYENGKALKRFTANQLAAKLNLKEDQFLGGRKLRTVLGDMELEGLLTKSKGYYYFKQEEFIQKPTKPVFELTPDLFKEQLLAAIEKSEPKRVIKNSDEWWRTSIKQVSVTETSVIPTELDLVVPNEPNKTLAYGTTNKPFDEVFETFDFSEEAFNKLKEIVLQQRFRLQSQDRLIREMHVCIRDLHRMMSTYVSGKEFRGRPS